MDIPYKDQVDKRYYKTCPTCSKKFYKRKCISYKQWSEQKVCGWTCRRPKQANKHDPKPPYHGKNLIFRKPCKQCGKIIEVKNFYNFRKRKFCSKKCCALYHKNLNRWSDERREKLRQKQLKKVKDGTWLNPILKPGVITKELREKWSRVQTELYLQGKQYFDYYNSRSGWYFSTKLNKKIYHRSNYERQTYKLLDKDDNVIHYETEPFRIPYNFDGINRNYIPDIIVYYEDFKTKLIEVKPSYKTKEEQNIKKFEAATRYCEENDFEFEVWTEKQIFKR